VNFHEQFDRRELLLLSDRSTDFVFAVVALIVAHVWRLYGIGFLGRKAHRPLRSSLSLTTAASVKFCS
jgi:hypothetical protein